MGKFQIYKSQHLQDFSILGFLKIRQNMTFLWHMSLSFVSFVSFEIEFWVLTVNTQKRRKGNYLELSTGML